MIPRFLFLCAIGCRSFAVTHTGCADPYDVERRCNVSPGVVGVVEFDAEALGHQFQFVGHNLGIGPQRQTREQDRV